MPSASLIPSPSETPPAASPLPPSRPFFLLIPLPHVLTAPNSNGRRDTRSAPGRGQQSLSLPHPHLFTAPRRTEAAEPGAVECRRANGCLPPCCPLRACPSPVTWRRRPIQPRTGLSGRWGPGPRPSGVRGVAA